MNQTETYYHHLRRVNPNGGDRSLAKQHFFHFENEVKPILPPDFSAKILEIGSGFGYLALFLLELGYTNVGIVDRCPDLLKTASELCEGRLAFAKESDAMAYVESCENQFDVILLFDLIEHIPVPIQEAFSRSIYCALKPGGRVIIRTPNMASLLAAYSRYIDLTHTTGFTEFSLTQLLVGVGFSIPNFHHSPVQGTFKERILQRILRKFELQLFRIQQRTKPKCYGKNLVAWAEKSIR